MSDNNRNSNNNTSNLTDDTSNGSMNTVLELISKPWQWTRKFTNWIDQRDSQYIVQRHDINGINAELHANNYLAKQHSIKLNTDEQKFIKSCVASTWLSTAVLTGLAALPFMRLPQYGTVPATASTRKYLIPIYILGAPIIVYGLQTSDCTVCLLQNTNLPVAQRYKQYIQYQTSPNSTMPIQATPSDIPLNTPTDVAKLTDASITGLNPDDISFSKQDVSFVADDSQPNAKPR